MKSLSVVITMYNQAHSIESAVESVLNQAVSVGEIIVVDGGSTDGSVEKVNAMQVQNIKLVELEGCSIASMRNEGVKASSNHYVAFLDAADQWMPFFTFEMQKLQDTFPCSDVFATRYQRVDTEGNPVDANIFLDSVSPEGYLLSDFFKMVTLGDMPFTVSSMMVKKANFLALGGFAVSEHTRVPKDFILQAALDGTIAYSPNIHMHCKSDAHKPGFEDLFPVGTYASAERLYTMVMAGRYSQKTVKSIQHYCAVQGLEAVKSFINDGNQHAAKAVLSMPMCQHRTVQFVSMIALMKLHAVKSALGNVKSILSKEWQS